MRERGPVFRSFVGARPRGSSLACTFPSVQVPTNQSPIWGCRPAKALTVAKRKERKETVSREGGYLWGRP